MFPVLFLFLFKNKQTGQRRDSNKIIYIQFVEKIVFIKERMAPELA